MANPDGLGLADRYSRIFNKVPQPKPYRPPKVPYAKTSASTTQYYTHGIPKPKPKAPPRPRPASPTTGYTVPSGGGGGGGINLPQGLLGGAQSALSGSWPSQTQLLRQAQLAVGAELDPQLRVLSQAQSQENKDYGFNLGQLNTRTSRSKADISSLYGALDVLLGANVKKQQALYDTAKTGVKGSYDALAAKLGEVFGTAKTQTQDELNRLGINQNPSATDRLTQDQAYLTGLSATQKANALSSVESQKQSQAGEASQFRGQQAAVAPQLISRIQIQSNDQQQVLLKSHLDTLSKLRNEIGNLNSTRSAKVNQTLKALQDQLYQRQQDAQQMQFLNSIKAAELGISAGQLDVAKQRLALDSYNTTNSLALRAKQLEATLNKQNKVAPTSQEKAFGYIAAAYPRKDAKSQSAVQNALLDIINGNSNDPGYTPPFTDPITGKRSGGIPGYDPKYLNNYLNDAEGAVRDRAKQGWGPIELNILRNAILRYFGR